MQLGFANDEGDERLTQRTPSLTFAQGFLLNPAISRELLRGGIDTEVEPRGGPDNRGATLFHRDVSSDGKLNFFGGANFDKDNGERPNSDLSRTVARQDTTYVQGRGNLYAHLLHRRDRSGLPGLTTTLGNVLAADDRLNLDFNEGLLAYRHRLGSAHLWAGLFSSHAVENRTNAGADNSFARNIGFRNASIVSQKAVTAALEPELRLDWSLRRQSGQSSMLSIGATRTRTQSLTDQNLQRANGTPNPDTGNARLRQNITSALFYAQWANQINEKTSLIAQLRRQHINYSVVENRILGGPPREDKSNLEKSYWLPSLVLNHRMNGNSNLRLIANRRVTDVTPSVFAPTATLITTEGETVPAGLPEPAPGGDLKTLEIEAERHDRSGGLWKLFVFHSSARNLIYDFSGFANPTLTINGIQKNSLTLDRVRRSGAGLRYDRQWGKNWFSNFLISSNRTVTNTAGAQFDGRIAPYQPRLAARLGLNYLDSGGVKIGVFLNHSGAFFADSAFANPVRRPLFGAKTTFDLELAKEPSVRAEFFVRVVNVFNTPQIIFSGIPVNPRRIQAGVTRRF